jgi:tripartite-type tricarboxylate transporter receptor subunit TctC
MRIFAKSAGAALGGTMVVENKPGAGGTLGAAAMVSAKPDGYTITQIPLGVFRLPHLQKMPFDPLKDMTPVVGLTGYTFGIACVSEAPYRSLAELVQWAKRNPGQLQYAHTGVGTTPHLAFDAFARQAGFTAQGIPYKGTAEIMQAILGGQVQLMCGTTEFSPHVESGRMRLLATLGRERIKRFPQTPTVRECGWDTVSESPVGIAGPAGMDPAVVAKLHSAFHQSLRDPEVLAMLDRYDQPVIYMDTVAYQDYARRTYASERTTLAHMGLLRQD